ncbi:ATP-binding protein [Flammeovirgaceae bacterium SG7u.111]|nr:ATP-binding protein [Flammeovirgaceae bacterium SG7u.132]WPO38071.1 ATP-binding protein [Flammeovirgaceae bacterium SG7u.111]
MENEFFGNDIINVAQKGMSHGLPIVHFHTKEMDYSVRVKYLGNRTFFVTQKGKFRISLLLQHIQKLKETFHNLGKDRGSKRLFLCVDFARCTGSDKESRKFLKEYFEGWFEGGLVVAIALVGPPPMVKTIAGLSNLKNSKIRYTFHENMDEAINYINSLRTGMAGKSIENTAYSEDWGLRTHIYSNGKKLNIQHSPGWSLSHDMSAFTAFAYLIRGDVLLMKLHGDMKPEHVQDVYRLSRSILNFSRKSKIYMVLDISEVPNFTFGVRKEFEKFEEVYSKYWLKTIMVLSPIGNTLMSLYQLFRPTWADRIVAVKSLHQGLEACSQEPREEEVTLPPEKNDLLEKAHNASREELLDMYENLLSEKQEEEAFHRHRMSELFEVIGQTTWMPDFRPVSKNISEDDPYYELFSAAYLLQHDLYEILSEREKENKVLERNIEAHHAELVNNENALRSILENNDDAIWLIDGNYKLVDFNHNFTKLFLDLFGIAPKVGGDVLMFTTEKEKRQKFWKEKYEKALKGEPELFQVRGGHGKPPVLDIRIFPVEENGEFTRLACFSKDITAQVHAEEQLKKSRRQLQLLLEQIPAILFTFDSELNVASMMGKGLENLSLKPNQMAGQHLEEFNQQFGPDDTILEAHQNGLRGISGKYELSFANRNYLSYVEPLYEGRAQKVTGVLNLSIDITDIKKSEERLKLQNDELKKVNRELDQFVYSVSHDLRAPLASVSGLISLALDSEKLDEIQEYLQLQEKSVSRLDAFIKEIINLSRNSRMEIESEEVDFQKMIDEIYENQAFSEDAKNVNKLVNISQKAPFYSDSRRIKVAVGNLISNAIRYSMPERGDAEVKVSIMVDDKKAAIRVKDNGIGIESQYMGKIFNMFYRATQRKSGSGLGLYIVQETMSKLDGSIDVTSELGKGSEFVLIIPNRKAK